MQRVEVQVGDIVVKQVNSLDRVLIQQYNIVKEAPKSKAQYSYKFSCIFGLRGFQFFIFHV